MELSEYRPPGRSNRSGRTGQSDNDVFEGLPVKQWGEQPTRVSLVTPQQSEEAQTSEDSKWGEPPMPRDYQLLQPWTQHILRLARSGKVGVKRKAEDEKGEDEVEEEGAGNDESAAKKHDPLEDRAFLAKKWKPVPEHALVPEHMHWEFLAKRRKGLPSMYGPADTGAMAPVPMRRTRVQKADAGTGEIALYDVLVPEGHMLDNEVAADSAALVDVKSVVAAPGTVIEGVGIANDDGVVVAEHLMKPLVSERRRNRPPPKKKGGPGRGKKRVTFTNPDGSTYTTVVPNATKIVPQPGQTVKHVAKGEEASANQNARIKAAQEMAEGEDSQQQPQGEQGEHGEAEGEGNDDDEGSDDGEEGDDDDDREEGELTDEEGQHESTDTQQPNVEASSNQASAPERAKSKSVTPVLSTSKQEDPAEPGDRAASSSPDLPLAHSSHSRKNSMMTPKTTAENSEAVAPEDTDVTMNDASPQGAEDQPEEEEEEDLLGNLEQSLQASSGTGGGNPATDGMN
ncbi:hypothetical protein MBLNU230_g6926t1 [Neophaeotheca triangularis]